MTIPTVDKDSIMRAVPAMDVYHREFNFGVKWKADGDDDVEALPDQVGNWSVSVTQNLETIGFFAQEYTWNGSTVIAYRGTDDDFSLGSQGDAKNGYGLAIGPVSIWATME
jgi:hypothetical protein